MNINKEAIKELMTQFANDNWNEFARQLGIDVSHLYRTITEKQRKAGAKFIQALLKFCKLHNLNSDDYIFLQ